VGDGAIDPGSDRDVDVGQDRFQQDHGDHSAADEQKSGIRIEVDAIDPQHPHQDSARMRPGSRVQHHVEEGNHQAEADAFEQRAQNAERNDDNQYPPVRTYEFVKCQH
jgi:hypothetical protein